MVRRMGASLAGVALLASLCVGRAPAASSTSVFDDHFTGNSGGLPAGWPLAVGTGTAVESGSVVALLDHKLLIGSDARVDPNSGTVTLVVDIAGVTGAARAGTGLMAGSNVFAIFLQSSDGQIRVAVSDAESGGQGYVAGYVSGYAGGPIRATVVLSSTSFRVSTDSPPFDSGDLDYARVCSTFTRASLGNDARMILVNDVSEGQAGSSSFDRLVVDVGVPVAVEKWSFGRIKALYRR